MAHSGKERKKVLITVKAYPLPSRSYDELVCTAGITEDGDWIRIYPVPFRFLSNEGQYNKYQWVELDLKRREDDFRPESYSPVDTGLKDLKIIEDLNTQNHWRERKIVVLDEGPKIYSSKRELIEDSKEPKNISLAVFKPARFTDFIIEEDEREWKGTFQKNLHQKDLFDERGGKGDRDIVKKLPFKFYYEFEDKDGESSQLMIEDWEIGALYWNCLRNADGNEQVACRKVRDMYWDNFINNKDLYLFLGTTFQWHTRRSHNPFVIIGVFYPPMDPQANQQSLFWDERH
jgi:hypothetical protein